MTETLQITAEQVAAIGTVCEMAHSNLVDLLNTLPQEMVDELTRQIEIAREVFQMLEATIDTHEGQN